MVVIFSYVFITWSYMLCKIRCCILSMSYMQLWPMTCVEQTRKKERNKAGYLDDFRRSKGVLSKNYKYVSCCCAFSRPLRFLVQHHMPKLTGTNLVVFGLVSPLFFHSHYLALLMMLVHYLGCHLGLDISSKRQITFLLIIIRKKRLFWPIGHLSCWWGQQ